MRNIDDLDQELVDSKVQQTNARSYPTQKMVPFSNRSNTIDKMYWKKKIQLATQFKLDKSKCKPQKV